MTSKYPRTLADLDSFSESELVGRSRESIDLALQRGGYTDDEVARLLGTDTATVFALKSGVFSTVVSPDGVVMALPEVLLPQRALRLKVAFARLISACEQLPPRDVPSAPAIEVAHLGEVNLHMAAWLKDSLRGYTATYRPYSLPNQVQRVQALQSIDMSVATLAFAIDVPAEEVAQWLMADTSDLPWSASTDGFERWLNAMRYLATGPFYVPDGEQPEWQHRPRRDDANAAPDPARCF
jgi:hypothetical protein